MIKNKKKSDSVRKRTKKSVESEPIKEVKPEKTSTFTVPELLKNVIITYNSEEDFSYENVLRKIIMKKGAVPSLKYTLYVSIGAKDVLRQLELQEQMVVPGDFIAPRKTNESEGVEIL